MIDRNTLTSTIHHHPEFMYYYYLVNQFWINFNVFAIAPFLFVCWMRWRSPQLDKKLWSDHIARVLLVITELFYLVDMTVKYKIDGAETICEKGVFIHHLGSVLIIPPMIINNYIPWWVNPIAFMHGFSIYFPELAFINYIYALFLILYTYKIHQEPFRHFRCYWMLRIAICFIWVFILAYLLDDCSNYLPIGPDN